MERHDQDHFFGKIFGDSSFVDFFMCVVRHMFVIGRIKFSAHAFGIIVCHGGWTIRNVSADVDKLLLVVPIVSRHFEVTDGLIEDPTGPNH